MGWSGGGKGEEVKLAEEKWEGLESGGEERRYLGEGVCVAHRHLIFSHYLYRYSLPAIYICICICLSITLSIYITTLFYHDDIIRNRQTLLFYCLPGDCAAVGHSSFHLFQPCT